MWLRSIYLSSGFAVLVWLLPYAVGVTYYHLLSRHWKRAVGWLLLVLFVPSLVLAWVFAHALENVIYVPHTTVLIVSCCVMVAQAVFWRLVWYRYRKEGEISHRRTIAFCAFLISILLTLLAVGSFFKEWAYDYRAYAHLQQQSVEDQERLDMVGYAPYPDAEYPLGTGMIHGDGCMGGDGGFLSMQFRSADEPGRVLDFYRERAGSAGLRTYSGMNSSGGNPMMIALGDDRTAMEVQGWSEDMWLVTIYWNTSYDFRERIELDYKLESPEPD